MVTMPEFIEAANSDRIIEVFGCGTACMIAPIHSIHYEGQVCTLPFVLTVTLVFLCIIGLIFSLGGDNECIINTTVIIRSSCRISTFPQ